MNSSSSKLLKTYFERKKAARPGFTLRNFAKILKVAPSFASRLLTGQKAIPLSRLDELAEVLELDPTALRHLKRALVEETLKIHGLDVEELLDIQATKKYQLAPKSQFSVLNPWYHIAIMDLTTCSNFKKDNDWIAKRLKISKYQVEESIRLLIQQGLLSETKKGYTKVKEKIRLSLNESNIEIRKFHAQMIEKAKEELLKNTTKASFDRREISGITIAANPKNIAKARQRLVEALHEVAEIISEGECTDLFQLNTQLFSLLSSEG